MIGAHKLKGKLSNIFACVKGKYLHFSRELLKKYLEKNSPMQLSQKSPNAPITQSIYMKLTKV